jgi:hypothetical protein
MKLLLPLIYLLLTSCSEKEEAEPIVNHAWDTSFYAPRVGEKLIYRELVESVSHSQSKPISPADIKKTTNERIQIYNGPESIEGKMVHKFSIIHNGTPNDELLFEWNGEILSLVGSVQKDGTYNISQNIIPISDKNMIVGAYWHWPISAPFGSGSRVTAIENVTVPAGTYKAHKISVKSSPLGQTSLRQYWFAPKVGIVKEESKVYSGGLLRAMTTIELVDQINLAQEPTETSE